LLASSQTAREQWCEVIAETENVLDGVSLIGGKIIASYMQDAKSVVKVFDLEGHADGAVDLPGIGTAFGFQGDMDDPETFFSYSSFKSKCSRHPMWP
jgi:prolyl oligopeptidase